MHSTRYRLLVLALCVFCYCESYYHTHDLLPETRWVLTEAGIPCFFPFEFLGELHHHCIEADAMNTSWCCIDGNCNRTSGCLGGEVDLPVLLMHDQPHTVCTLRALDNVGGQGEFRWTPSPKSDCDQRRPTVFIFEDGDVMWRASTFADRLDALMQLARNLKEDGSVLDSSFEDAFGRQCSPIEFVFLSYASDEFAVESWTRDMQDIFIRKIENSADFDARRQAFHFISEPAWHVQESKCWLSSILHSHSQVHNFVTVYWKDSEQADTVDVKKVNAIMRASTCGTRSRTWPVKWANSSFPSAPRLKWFGVGCGDAILKKRYGIAKNDSWPDPETDVAGAVAVVVEGNCSAYTKAHNAFQAGAVALIVVSDGDICADIGCAAPDNCGSLIEMVTISIAGREGQAVLAALFKEHGDRELIGHFSRKRHGPLFVGMHGSGGGLHLAGALPARGIALEARGMLREARIRADRRRLEKTVAAQASFKEEAKTAEIYQVFNDKPVMGDWISEKWSVENSKRVRQRQYTSLQIELWMDCKAHNEMMCDPWDREIYLFLCPKSDERCVNGYAKIGQWITTYGREGRWLHDTTVMLPLLMEASYANSDFVFHFAGLGYSAGRVNISVFLWFQRKNPTATVHHGVPVGDLSTTRVIGWGHGPAMPFDSTWNTEKQPLMRPGPKHFYLPAEATRVVLSVLITGHGWGVNKEDCAEFCNHTHHFTVDGSQELVKSHSLAGSSDGCLKQVDDGVIPNQHGTWGYGRAGWCPGMQVNWWEVDVTHLLLQGKGIQHNVTYKALFNGSIYTAEHLPPAERDPDGRECEIIMSSFITFFKEPTLLEPAFVSVSYVLGGAVVVSACLLCCAISVYLKQSSARRTSLLAHQDGLEASSAGMLELSCMEHAPQRPVSGLDFREQAIAVDPNFSKS